MPSLARSITAGDWQARALATVAQAAARTGDPNRAEALARQAETLARSITDPDQQARVLATLVREAEPDHGRSLLALALTIGTWQSSVAVLARADPGTVIAIAGEYLNPAS